MIHNILLLILVNVISALTYPIGKLSFNYGNPLFLTGVRMIVAGFLLAIFEYFWTRKTFKVTKQFIVQLLALSFFNVFLTNCLQFWALDYTTASKAIFIFNMSPFIAAVLSYFIYGETMSYKKIIALVIAFAGFLPVLFFGNANYSTQNLIDLPEVALVIAALVSVIGWFIMKQLLQVTSCSFIMINGLSMLIGGLLFFPVSFFTEGPQWYYSSNILMASAYLAILIIANNFINYNAYAYFLKYLSPTLIFLISFTGPLFTLFFGWLFLGEKIGYSFLFTIIIVGYGLYLYYNEEIRLQKV